MPAFIVEFRDIVFTRELPMTPCKSLLKVQKDFEYFLEWKVVYV